MIIVWVLVAVVAVILLWVIVAFNSLVILRNRAKEALSDISVQSKRRYDLIPNLVETVKGYAKHESIVFTAVTQARSQAMQAKGLADKAKAENQLTDTIKSLFAVAENYPQLRASENYSKLQDELTVTEDKIEASRRYYNGSVRDLLNKMQVFPTNLMAKKLGFEEMPMYEPPKGQEGKVAEPPKVDFKSEENK